MHRRKVTTRIKVERLHRNATRSLIADWLEYYLVLARQGKLDNSESSIGEESENPSRTIPKYIVA
jgi:hypothetical protein